ncbi:hypothetical protein K493DRAFT_296878 [Basidiobolus meristosporus CBS 931.73]|uniref:GDP-fucose protein O-fucosyltransferase 2 n=1 Tax=Basidiobolus meristosporus CBS 931.73 TaxID=1314790 RepID=A0A1Y1Z313_9FUNG|nr:hypothetical protein K493DRAFT_296878 [Basidiobolus meristosporus CBS 931.73]|eukprot:ORY04599.1 hypothetical protein K493DRAFT_296878 [Basidiobolus meristosporus CBS 931.73]
MGYSEKDSDGALPLIKKFKSKSLAPRITTQHLLSYSTPNSATTLSPSTPFPGTPRVSRRCTRLFVLFSLLLTVLALAALTSSTFPSDFQTTVSTPDVYLTEAMEPEPEIHPPFECGEDLGIPCKFIFPTFIAEQESKGIQHFWQLAMLAKQLNRTMVLPNTFTSRMSTCYQYPFSHYFSVETLKAADVPFVYMSDFYDWVGRQGDVPAQPVLFQGRADLHSTWSKRKYVKTSCLGNWQFNLDEYERLVLSPDKGYWRTPESRANTNKYIVDSLTNSVNAEGETPTVYLVEYRFLYRFIEVERTSAPLNYHPYIQKKVDNVVASLGPFIAVHWRMETVTPYQNLPRCAENLIRSLKRISEAENIKTIYLATDYPLEDLYPHSGSWDLEELTDYHHNAIRIMKSNVQLESWISLEQGRHVNDTLSITTEQDFDPGLLGIFDKMMCTRASYFLAGPPECSRASSFTAQIANTREQLQSNGLDKVALEYRNIMDRWSF